MQRLLLTILIVTLALGTTAFAQDGEDELECPAFETSSPDVRIGYYMGEGAAFVASGQTQAAAISYTCIIEQIDANYLDAYLNRAFVYTRQRDFEAALEDYDMALALAPNTPEIHNNRGILQAALQAYELALEEFNAALSIDPQYVNALNNRGVIYMTLGDPQAALADFEATIAITGIDQIVAELRDPDRPPNAEAPDYENAHARAYALMGIVYSEIALQNYSDYLVLSSDRRIESAAGALESRLRFELRLDDGTWLLAADLFADEDPDDG